MLREPPSIVLLVEDDPATADMYALGLNLCGYPVQVAHTAEAGLTHVANGMHPRLIVLDLVVPTIGGLEMLLLLRKSPSTSSVPVIVLSNQDMDFPEAYRRGATKCLAKYSTTPGELVMHVRTVVGHPLSEVDAEQIAGAKPTPRRVGAAATETSRAAAIRAVEPGAWGTGADPKAILAEQLLAQVAGRPAYDPEAKRIEKVSEGHEGNANIVGPQNLTQRQQHAELAAAAVERAWANQQRARANRALANAQHHLGADEVIARAQAELYGGWAQMHAERARAHECRAARHFREAAKHDRDADAYSVRLLAAVERLYAARH
jgi:CheY-like chemotaxis protein